MTGLMGLVGRSYTIRRPYTFSSIWQVYTVMVGSAERVCVLTGETSLAAGYRPWERRIGHGVILHTQSFFPWHLMNDHHPKTWCTLDGCPVPPKSLCLTNVSLMCMATFRCHSDNYGYWDISLFSDPRCDSGTVVTARTPSMRRKERQTKSHSTMRIDHVLLKGLRELRKTWLLSDIATHVRNG